ncbi:NUDIX domain-containing protein [Mobilicoccus pelagius]|uniref:ADP-ribose pyrophosphatase n=1 Tax=Mobilicoccus pelagius NBRC 104925 TaxID=1089455 RepID=H5UV66_9MICO|nr:NUDIX hydrolase [Mobilicoccus pelagius]GAB49624.1 ADP-ribose pyrophosphatase [Mobilicoccus pelagius NBRC 104925]
MSLDAPIMRGVDLDDDRTAKPVTATETVYEGMIWDVRRDTVDLGSETVQREFIEHTGAVSVVALQESPGTPRAMQVALIRQYRHPIGATEWEIPAGLLDKEGEPPLEAAQRELAEEVDLTARTWHVLADFHPSPGAMSEAIRVYLARDLEDVPAEDRFEREAEEAGMSTAWVDLDEAFAAVLAGRVGNASAVIGILAAHGAKEADWVTLRSADAPWPAHPAHR